jgi:glycosyltransferase involved in cell wall biosynthesis
MRKVLHILGRIERSGMERMLESSYGLWEECGWEVQILSLSEKSEYQETLMRLGYKIENLRNPWKLIGLLSMARFFRQTKPDVLHNHVERRHALTSLVAYIAVNKSKRVRTVHSNFSDQGFRYMVRRAQNFVEKITGFTIIVPSEDVQLNEEILWKRRTNIIENWAPKYEPSQDRRCEQNEIHMMILGNCSEVKRHELAFRLADEVGRNNKHNFRIVIHHVGSALGASATEIGILESVPTNYKIVVHGSIVAPQRVLQQSDCLIITSSREGQSVSMLEAIRMGIPCIAIAVPGLNWAGSIPKVFLAENESRLVSAFESFLEAKKFPSSSETSQQIDERFSPNRGVRDYCRMYERES